MSLSQSLLNLAVAFIVFGMIFRPLEMVFPAREQAFQRAHWLADLGFMVGQYLLWNGLLFLALEHLRFWVDSFFSAGYVAALRAQPLWLHALEAVFLSDLSIYWAHRLQHRWDWLWRFHAVHHSAEHLDWLAAHREHPLDSIYSVCAMNLPIFLIGFPLETLGWLLAFRGLWAIFIHSNIRMPLGIFGLLAGSPAFHHWHHAKDRDVGNYANLSPLMDVLFGTHHAPETAPESLGLKEKMPQSYLGLLWHPFRRRERTPKTTE